MISNARLIRNDRLDKHMENQSVMDDSEKHRNAYVIRADPDGILSSDFDDNEDRFIVLDAKALTGLVDDRFLKVLVMNSDRISQFILGGSTLSEKSLNDICCQALPKLRYMTSLDLSYLTIPYEGFNSLCHMINPIASGYCPLQKLNLSRTKLGFKGCCKVFDALAGNISIKELYLCGNGCTDKAIPALINFLCNPDNSTVSLGLSHNNITAEGIRLLAPVLGDHRHITELKLSGNPFGSDGATELFSKLWQSKLKIISMIKCGITTCNWTSPMMYMTCLESLFLAQNTINPTSFQTLCENLHRCACIRHLDVSYNALNGLPTSCVGTLMKLHKGLISINMSGNKFPGEVTSAIILGIYANCTLRVLDLSSCDLSVDMALSLCGALAKNSLLTLRLSNNPIPTDMRTNPRISAVYQSRRASVELSRGDLESCGLLQHDNLIKAVLTGSDIISGSSGVVAENEEHLEFAFIDALTAETASSIWRRRRIDDINKSKRAYQVIHGMRAEEDVGNEHEPETDIQRKNDVEKMNDHELQVHIDPGATGEREKQQAMNSQIALFDIIDGKCVLNVSYGRRTEVLGTIEVSETMSYFDTRALVLPLLHNYFRTGDKKRIESAKNYKMLDGMGAILSDEAERVRVAWAELSTSGYCLHIQPADWLCVPK